MGKIANDLAKKHNLKDAKVFTNALAELNAHYDQKLIPVLNTTAPTIDFARKSKTTTDDNSAELIYPTSEELDDTFARTYLAPEFATHPQIDGRITATIAARGSQLVITTPLGEANRIEQNEQTLLPNVMKNSWMKYGMSLTQSIQEVNRRIEAERLMEIRALEFLRS